MEGTIKSRTRFTDEEKKAIVERCRQSGLSKGKFAVSIRPNTRSNLQNYS